MKPNSILVFRRGYYPKGGGEVIVRMSPVKQLSPISLIDRGTVTKIYGRAFVAGTLPIKVSFSQYSVLNTVLANF